MNRLQIAGLLVALTTGNCALGALLSSDSGYQYDRPAFGSDFGRRPAPVYGPSNVGQFGRQPGLGGGGGGGFPGGAYQGGSSGFNQGFQGDSSGGGFQGFNGRSRPYSFEYEVKDAASGNDYGQQESGDEYGSVRGEYRVLLPDTRTQIVRYMADDANGYIADVRYEGEAQFPRPGAFGGGFQPGRGIGGLGGGYSGGGPNDGFGGGGGYPGGNQYLPPNAGSYGK